MEPKEERILLPLNKRFRRTGENVNHAASFWYAFRCRTLAMLDERSPLQSWGATTRRAISRSSTRAAYACGCCDKSPPRCRWYWRTTHVYKFKTKNAFDAIKNKAGPI
jgi:hypothetical protein